MAWSAGQRYLAEFLGSFGLLLIGGGSAVYTLGAFDLDARAVLVSLCFGLVILAVVYALGDVSGGHFNPAVTVAMWFARRMRPADVGPYLVVQVLGGIVGMAVVLGIVSSGGIVYPLAQAAAMGSQCFAGFGAPAASCPYSLGSVFLLEVALTFVFVFVILSVTRPDNSAKNLAPVAIGFTLLIANLVAIPVDGSSINPIRSFSPAVVSVFWPTARWAIAESWLFWVAPILGGILAAASERFFHPSSA